MTWIPAAAVIAVPFLSPGSPVSLVPVAAESAQQLAITGRIDGLRSGVSSDLALTLRSASDHATDVHAISVRVTGASAGCAAGALAPSRWTGHLVVPARSEVRVSVPVLLTDPAGTCAGATWRLAYTSS